MMRILITIIICVLLTQSANAYWQQKVDHKISVTLDDKNHVLRGYQEITYTNNSPDTLRYIFLHLYPNAYKHDHTAFAKQKVENGNTDFYFSEKVEKGFIDSLSFTSNDLPMNYSRYNDQVDIIFLELINPLLPGASVEINTPFRVVIPKNFSRMGHMDQTYQITQWYPKPAVYDKDGWHMMPYLDQGEFFYEYGDYDVDITLPENYVVAATGDLQTESEVEFRESRKLSVLNANILNENKDTPKFQAKNETIASSKKLKTIRFTQEMVHDFAWFADKQFMVEQKDFKLPSGALCSAFSFFTPANAPKYKGSTEILKETITYLSNEVGEYPYKQVSIVDGPLFAGGGMEYPNIAIIGKLPSKDVVNIVTVHEVGHNWFQGILGSNEREHPWLDEGMNSFYEAKIVEEIKQKELSIAASGGNAEVYILNGHVRKDQPIELPATDYLDANYGGVVYAKAAKALALLEDYIGPHDFKQGMQQYFRDWKQKHPSPNDLRAALEKNTNKDISWFFNNLIKSNKPLDYKIQSVKTKGQNKLVTVRDKFGSNYPVPVFAMKGKEVLQKTYSVNGEALLDDFGTDVTYQVDQEGLIPEINDGNNGYKPGALFKRSQPRIGLGTGFFKAGANKLYLMPIVGYNHYDRTMAGLAFHNLKVPNSQFQFAMAPLYSFKSKQLNGTGVVGYCFYPAKRFYRITASIQGQSFSVDSSNNRNLTAAIYPRFYKINPRVSFELQKASLRNPIERSIVLNYFHTGRQQFNYSQDPIDSLYKASIGSYAKQNLFRVNYIYNNKRTFNPYGYNIQYESTKNISKLTAQGNIKIDYNMPKKALYVRAFAGKFFYLNNEYNYFDVVPYFLNTTPTAVNDYAYENIFIGRNESSGYQSQQVLDREGGFTTRTTLLANPLGRSDDWLAAVNLRSDIPYDLWLLPQLFFNVATFADAGQTNPSGNKTLYEGGLRFNLVKNLIAINIPLVFSKDFKEYNQTIYPKKERGYRQISFSISTDRIDFLRTQENVTKFIF